MITEEDVNRAFEEEFDGVEKFLLVQEILTIREVNRWIPVSERLPNDSAVMLFCWRPIDFAERPQHKEVIVGTFCYKNEQGKPVHSPTKVWCNGMYYDIETHITHWKPLTVPSEDKESKE